MFLGDFPGIQERLSGWGECVGQIVASTNTHRVVAEVSDHPDYIIPDLDPKFQNVCIRSDVQSQTHF